MLIQVLGRWILSTGRTWLISSIISIVVWFSMIIIRLIMPAGLTIDNWLPGNTGTETVVLQFSTETWILGFLLVSLLVAVVFVEAKNLEQGDYINVLSGSMTLTAFGLLAILSGSGIAFLLTWVMVDLFEFSVLAWIITDRKTHNTAVSALLVRISGIILMLFIVVMQDPITLKVGTDNGKVITGLLLLFVAILRSGIIPIHLPYTANVSYRRGISTILRFIPPLSVMAFLLNIGVQEFSIAQLPGFNHPPCSGSNLWSHLLVFFQGRTWRKTLLDHFHHQPRFAQFYQTDSGCDHRIGNFNGFLWFSNIYLFTPFQNDQRIFSLDPAGNADIAIFSNHQYYAGTLG